LASGSRSACSPAGPWRKTTKPGRPIHDALCRHGSDCCHQLARWGQRHASETVVLSTLSYRNSLPSVVSCPQMSLGTVSIRVACAVSLSALAPGRLAEQRPRTCRRYLQDVSGGLWANHLPHAAFPAYEPRNPHAACRRDCEAFLSRIPGAVAPCAPAIPPVQPQTLRDVSLYRAGRRRVDLPTSATQRTPCRANVNHPFQPVC
jgi:hypothetical protein